MVSLTEGMRYGVNKANNEEIIAIIARLKENIENSNIMTQQTKYEKLLYGNWRLAWTTEKVSFPPCNHIPIWYPIITFMICKDMLTHAFP